MKKEKNILNQIRERNGISVDDFAEILGVTKQGYYNLVKNEQPLKRKYFDKIKHLLTEEEIKEMYNPIINYTNSIINTNQTNCTNYNNIQQPNKNVQIDYYNNIIDLSNQSNSIKKQYDIDILRIITNGKPIQDYSKLIFCKNNNQTLIIDTMNTTPTDKTQQFIIKNELGSDNSTCFVADVKRNVLNNKIIMYIDGQELEILDTCKIIGVVLCVIS